MIQDQTTYLFKEADCKLILQPCLVHMLFNAPKEGKMEIQIFQLVVPKRNSKIFNNVDPKQKRIEESKKSKQTSNSGKKSFECLFPLFAAICLHLFVTLTSPSYILTLLCYVLTLLYYYCLCVEGRPICTDVIGMDVTLTLPVDVTMF